MVSFTVYEFTAHIPYDDEQVVRILLRNETKEYEGRNRLSDRIPPEVFKYFFNENNPAFDSVWRVKTLATPGIVATDPDYNEDSIRSMGYDPFDHGMFAHLRQDIDIERAQAYLNSQFPDASFSFQLQHVNEIYFGPRVIGESSAHGDLYCIMILDVIMILIVVLAITNFVNLTSLTLPDRSKELAIRKVAGAARSPLLKIFAKENAAIVLMALVAGIVMILAAAGPARRILDVDFIQWINNNLMVSWFILILILVGTAVSPLIPAWAFIRATPGRLLSTDTITFPRMKKVIATIQLGVSISLIIASLVIDRQISRSLIKEPGKNHDQVIYMPYPAGLTQQGLNRLKLEWPRNNPNIVGLTAVSHTPDNLTSKPVGESYYRLNVDFDFKDFFGLEVADGRWFRANDNDSTMVNEAFAAVDPTSIGVVKNFAGIYNLPDKPVRITVAQDEYNFLMIRVLEVNIRSTLKVVQEISDRPVTVSCLDKNYEATLAYEDRLNRLSSLLSLVSIVMACCAIYALSLSRMKDNLKQIAIRKTFGASDRQIVQRLSWQFFELMLVALFFFGPLTYWLLGEWLRNFAYSAKFYWADPVISIGICLIIVAVTNLLLLARVNTTSLSQIHKR